MRKCGAAPNLRFLRCVAFVEWARKSAKVSLHRVSLLRLPTLHSSPSLLHPPHLAADTGGSPRMRSLSLVASASLFVGTAIGCRDEPHAAAAGVF